MDNLEFWTGFLRWVGIPCALFILAACALFRFTGRWPAWFYGLVFAWWWPSRPDSSLTIAAALLDDDPDCSKWRVEARYDKWSLTHGATRLEIKYETDGIFPYFFKGLFVDGIQADEDSWGALCLIRSVKAWERRDRAIDVKKAERGAAEAVLRAYKRANR